MKRAGWLLLAGGLVIAVTVILIVVGVNKNEQRINQTPTKSDVYKALVELRKSQRRACGVVNRRFNTLADLIAQQRPSPTTTAYYRDHPDELARARSYFDQTLAVLRPRNCRADYPPPSPADFGLTDGPRTKPPKGSQGAAPSKPADRRTTARRQGQPRKQASISPPRPKRAFPPSRPRQPARVQTPPQIAPLPSPDLPGTPAPPAQPKPLEPLCKLVNVALPPVC